MAAARLERVVHQLRRLAGRPAGAGSSDRSLLERFHRAGDQDAFATLVERHGPLVWGVCRRLLPQEQDAEDAYVGVFLVLARKAGSVRWRDSVANWLYGVATRLALRVRRADGRRRARERRAALTAGDRNEARGDVYRELCAALDEELAGLPERYRAPLVLCYLQGQTRDQAARACGWSLRTLDRRLCRGRELLHGRLIRRGFELPATLLGAGLAADVVEAGPRSVLALRAVAIGRAMTTGGSGAARALAPRAVALADGASSAAPAVKTLASLALVLVAVAASAFALFSTSPVLPTTPPTHGPASAQAGPPAAAAPDPFAAGKRFLVLPVATELQRLGLPPDAAPKISVYVLVDGLPFRAGGNRVNLDALDPQALQQVLPAAGRREGGIFFNIYWPSGGSQYRFTDEFVRGALTGWARWSLGYGHVVSAHAHMNDREGEAAWKAVVDAARRAPANRRDVEENGVGDDGVKVYPVRTALSAVLYGGADGVVDVRRPLPRAAGGKFPEEIQKAAARYAAKVNFPGKEKLLIRMTFAENDPAGEKRLLQEGAKKLCDRLGFVSWVAQMY